MNHYLKATGVSGINCINEVSYFGKIPVETMGIQAFFP
jgi:hypothetical protein